MAVDEPTQYTATMARAPRIHDVRTKVLRVIPDERGWLMEILRADDAELFTTFGQTYVSATYPGAVKAWHYHRRQVDHFACVAGMVKLVLVDTRPGSPTNGAINEFFIGTQNPLLVTNWKRNDKTIGIFGQAAYDITEQLELQVGVRWTDYRFDQFPKLVLFPGLGCVVREGRPERSSASGIFFTSIAVITEARPCRFAPNLELRDTVLGLFDLLGGAGRDWRRPHRSLAAAARGHHFYRE